MKQLKFMLAAATAISLATAAQADAQLVKEEISSETFDAVTTLDDTAAVMGLKGFSYEGDNPADNESVVVAGGANSTANALKVNTGTDPLLRKIDATGNKAVPLDATKKVYIDTMVQFTVTPNGDTVTKSDDDKLMIYLKEDLSDADAPKTNLVVKAGYKGAGTLEAKDYVLDIDGKKVLPDVWYSLKVVAYGNVAAVGEGMDVYPAFEIYIDDTLARIANAGSCADLQVPDNVPIFLLGSFSERLSAGTLFLSMQVNSSTLDKVGFAGEGKVDELVFSHDVEPQTAVDFTLALGEGVSAVSYTVGDTTGKLPDENGAISVDLNGISVTLSGIEYAPGYEAGNITAKSYQAENITVDANKKDIVTEGDTPTTGADIGFTGTPFAEFTGADLQTVVAWAGAGHVPAATVQKMSFNNTTGDPAGTVGSPERIAEEAYLLGCSPAEVEAKKEAFVFEAFDPQNPPTAEEFAGKGYNGEVVIEGATTLSDETTGKPNWATGHEKPAFYRARLKFK